MTETDRFNVFLVNDGRHYEVPFLKRLGDLSDEVCRTVKDAKTGVEYPVLAALVDHKLKELDFKLTMSHEVEFIGYNHPDGRRTYLRSLCFVLQNVTKTSLCSSSATTIRQTTPHSRKTEESGRCTAWQEPAEEKSTKT